MLKHNIWWIYSMQNRWFYAGIASLINSGNNGIIHDSVCLKTFSCKVQMNRNMGFPTTWYVRPAKAQTSLRIRAVLSEPLLVVWIFFDTLATDRTSFGVSKLKRRLLMHVWVYTCQKATLLEITCRVSNNCAEIQQNVQVGMCAFEGASTLSDQKLKWALYG